jgi:hypothetical protein
VFHDRRIFQRRLHNEFVFKEGEPSHANDADIPPPQALADHPEKVFPPTPHSGHWQKNMLGEGTNLAIGKAMTVDSFLQDMTDLTGLEDM